MGKNKLEKKKNMPYETTDTVRILSKTQGHIV